MSDRGRQGISHVDGVVVFHDGRTHLVRIAPEIYLQWGAPLVQLGEAAPALDAMRQALARVQEGTEDE